ncbi:hypothetical protein J4H86_03815 [Spiractinospora alimapuensis]|uniref:hypothetical protein n=1 Tax=Spiractinospora alimapuensis TaxID=2820884 RepID=UPI001F1D7A37|nr:hypothetical protein [Spiractinospora alimapuensis]QVQ52952.1 hypothetical protein J4H86_03815 [Spiractinospora alimapuensis]
MEIAANILAGLMIGAAGYVLRAAVLLILAQKSRIARNLLKSGDNLDKLNQQNKDKLREIAQLVNEKIPNITEEIAEESRTEKNHKRGIADAENSLDRLADAWDTRITALEEAGILAGPYILRPEALKLKHVEFLVAHGGYDTLNAGDLPLSPHADPQRPPNPVRELQTRITEEEKSKNRAEKRLRNKANKEIRNVVVPEPTRWHLEAQNQGRRGWLRGIVGRAARGDQGSPKEDSPAGSPQHIPPSDKRSTRKGTT